MNSEFGGENLKLVLRERLPEDGEDLFLDMVTTATETTFRGHREVERLARIAQRQRGWARNLMKCPCRLARCAVVETPWGVPPDAGRVTPWSEVARLVRQFRCD